MARRNGDSSARWHQLYSTFFVVNRRGAEVAERWIEGLGVRSLIGLMDVPQFR
jgi:hypothetical protein